jgi:hypothetical protein
MLWHTVSYRSHVLSILRGLIDKMRRLTQRHRYPPALRQSARLLERR